MLIYFETDWVDKTLIACGFVRVVLYRFKRSGCVTRSNHLIKWILGALKQNEIDKCILTFKRKPRNM